MPNNYLSVLYKHIIQVENKSVWGGGGGKWAQTSKTWGASNNSTEVQVSNKNPESDVLDHKAHSNRPQHHESTAL